MDNPGKVATPLMALAVSAPLKVPPAGLLPIASVIGAPALPTTLSFASSTCTVTAGVTALPPVVFVGC